jgi:hypothetical protein
LGHQGIKVCANPVENKMMRLFKRRDTDVESDLRVQRIKAEVLARVEDVTRNSKSTNLADIFASLLEDDISVKRGQPMPPRQPPARDTQAA